MSVFGNNTAGSDFSTIYDTCHALKLSSYLHTAGSGETVTRLWVYGRSYSGQSSFDLGIYSVSGGNPDARIGTVTVTIGESMGWYSADCSIALTNGTTYTVAIGNGGVPAAVGWNMGDDGDSYQRGVQSLPNPFGSGSDEPYRWSIYAELSASPELFTVMRRRQLHTHRASGCA